MRIQKFTREFDLHSRITFVAVAMMQMLGVLSMSLLLSIEERALADEEARVDGQTLSGVTTIFQLHDDSSSGKYELLAYSENTKILTRYRIEQGKFVKLREGKALSRLCAATPYLSGNRKYLLLGFCGGPGITNVPLRLQRTSWEFDDPQLIFEQASERPEINHLSQVGEDIVLSYFSSKYETKTEILQAGKDVLFRTRSPFATIRMGTSVLPYEGGLLFGRPYGDTLGQDGDVVFVKDGQRTLLPSYRGVSAIAEFRPQGKAIPGVFVADGWHQNYGAFAEARLSFLSKRSDSGRFALEILDVVEGESRLQKLFSFSSGEKNYLLAASDKKIYLYADINPSTVSRKPQVVNTILTNSRLKSGHSTWSSFVDTQLP